MFDRDIALAEGQARYGTIRNDVDEKQALSQWFEAHLKEFEKLSGAQIGLKAAAHGFSENLIKKALPGMLADHDLGDR